MNVFDLVAKITLDSSEYDQGLISARQSAQKTMGVAGHAIAVGIGNIVSNGFSTALSEAKKFVGSAVETGKVFDASIAQVAATMGITMDEMKTKTGEVDTAYGKFQGNLREFAQFMGKNTAFTSSQAADALNYMALAGYNVQESMDMLPNVLNLAAAGGMELALASDMITDSQSALGISFERTGQMVDQMAVAASKTNTSVSQLGEAILTVGAFGKGMAGGFVENSDGIKVYYDRVTELNGVLGVLADNGIKGTEGGTHLRNILRALQTPTEKAQKALDKLGVATYDETGSFRSMVDILHDLNFSMSEMSEETRNSTLESIFNATDLASINSLLGTSADRWDEVFRALLDTDGAAQQMSETMLDNLAGDLTIFGSAWSGLLESISDAVSPFLRDVVQFATGAVGEITDAFKTGGIDAAIEALMSNIGTLYDNIMETFQDSDIPFIRSLGDAMASLKTTFSWIIDNWESVLTGLTAIAAIKVTGNFLGMLGIGGPVAMGIQAIAAGAVLVITNWENIKGRWDTLFSALGGDVDDVQKKVDNLFKPADDAYERRTIEIELDSAKAQELVDLMNSIGEGGEKTQSELDAWKQLYDQLVLLFPEIANYVNLEKGEFTAETEVIKENIKAFEESRKTEAAQRYLEQAGQAVIDLQAEAYEKQVDYNVALSHSKKASSDLYDQLEEFGSVYGKYFGNNSAHDYQGLYNDALQAVAEDADDATQKVLELKNALYELKYDENGNNVGAKESYNIFGMKTSEGYQGQFTTETADAMQEAIDKIQSATQELIEYDNNTNTLKEDWEKTEETLKAAMEALHEKQEALNTIIGETSTQVTTATEEVSGLQSAIDSLPASKDITINVKMNQNGLTAIGNGDGSGVKINNKLLPEFGDGKAKNSHASGLNFVPYDEYEARLHRGEAVLNADQARAWRSGQGIGFDSSAIATAVADAIRSTMSQMSVTMDGESVGSVVTGYVSQNIASSMRARRYAT